MGWFSMDVECGACGSRFDVIVPREQAEAPQTCPCGGTAVRIPSRPNPTRASFRDGHRRFDKLRAQDAIDRAISETRPEDSKERGKLIVEKEKAK